MDIKDFIPQTGDIIVGQGHDWSAKLQALTNGVGATHGCVVTFPDGSNHDIPMVLSSEYNGCVHMHWQDFCSDPTYNIWVYRIIGLTTEEINYGQNQCEIKFLDVPYAYLAWPWFGWKALWNKALNPLGKALHLSWFHHDVDTENNWFTKNVFCTKQTYIFIDDATGIHPDTWKALRTIFHQWLPDTFQPMELKDVCSTNPTLFKLIIQRVNGITNLV